MTDLEYNVFRSVNAAQEKGATREELKMSGDVGLALESWVKSRGLVRLGDRYYGVRYKPKESASL